MSRLFQPLETADTGNALLANAIIVVANSATRALSGGFSFEGCFSFEYAVPVFLRLF